MINKKIKFSDSFHGNLNVLFLMNAPKSDLIRLYAKYFMAIIITIVAILCMQIEKNVSTQLHVIFNIIYMSRSWIRVVFILNGIQK